MQTIATQGFLHRCGKAAKNLWNFSRPHAFLGSLLQFLLIVALVIPIRENLDVWSVVTALLTILLVHIYGMGVNQIADLKIDRINKPDLPLASGAMSLRMGKLITIAAAVIGLGLATLHDRIFFLSNFFLFLGLSFYSIPPWQWKRFPVVAALTIAVSRSIFLTGGYFLSLSQTTSLRDVPNILWILMGFMFFYAIGIALAKDAPDIKGDVQFQIRTFAAKLGVHGIIKLTFGLQLTTILVTGILSVWDTQHIFLRWYAALHALGSLLLCANYWDLRKARCIMGRSIEYPHAAIVRYYMNLWKILYFELIIFLGYSVLAS